MVPTLAFAFFMNLVEIILHPLAIFTVGRVLQVPADFVLSMLQVLATLPVVMVMPLILIISGWGCLAVTWGRMVTGWRCLAVPRHGKLANSGYLNLRLGVT
jgi:hypothetical protein